MGSGEAPLGVDEAALQAVRARLAGTNINPDTLLATDYLNHFNEIIMMIELVPDMPEMLVDAKAWQPRGYVEHFRLSQFTERDLAIEAYGMLPASNRRQLEDTAAEVHARAAETLRRFEEILAAGGDHTALRNASMEGTRKLHRLVDGINAIIHGSAVALDQPDIDGLFGNGAAGPGGNSQDDIDALFK